MLLRVIRSFRNKALRRLFEKDDPSKLSVPNVERVRAVLQRLDDVASPADMDVPGWRFHPLKGRMRGRFAVNASGNWRITFGWENGEFIDVDLEDYH